MRRNALLSLWILNAVLLVILAFSWFSPDASLKNTHWRVPEPIAANYVQMLPPFPLSINRDSSRFISTLERPLFSSNRRPPPPAPPPEAAAPVDNLSTARLSGTFQGAGGAGIILNIAGKDRRIRLNESIDGWVLQSIQGRMATFASGGQVRMLQLPRAALSTFTGIAPPQPLGPPTRSAAPAPTPPAGSQPAQQRSRFGP